MRKFALSLPWVVTALLWASGMTGQAQPFSKEGTHLVAFQDPDPDSGAVDDGDYDVFYDRLSSDGNWFYDDDYGYIWQPNEAVSGSSWRPYSDGHWVWTDRGWCWVSNENFGWATYHYGRWIRISGTGWCWVPGDQWAPAYVSWRHTEDDDYVGWAPLPPEASVSVNVGVRSWCDNYYDIGPAAFAFIKIRDFCRPSYREYIAPPQQNITIINRTQNITNIAYNNNVIYNYGPQYERVSQIVQRQGQQVPNYKINYVSQAQPTAAFGTQAQGNQLRIVAPPAKLKPVATVQPQGAKELGKAQLERGWQNVPQSQAQQLRGKFVKDAPTPKTLPPKPLPPPKPQIQTTKAQQGPPNKTPQEPFNKPGTTPPAPNAQLPTNKTAAEPQKAEALKRQEQQKKEPNQPPSNRLEQPKNAGPPNQAAKTAAEKSLEQKKGQAPQPPKPGETARGAAEKGAPEKARQQRVEKGPPTGPEALNRKGEPPKKEQPNAGQTQIKESKPKTAAARHVESAPKPRVEQPSHPAQQQVARQARPQPAPKPQAQHAAQAAPHSPAPHPQAPRPQARPQPQKAEAKDKKKDHQG